MIKRIEEILSKSLKEPSSKALARYHLKEAVKHLKTLYEGNMSVTSLNSLQEKINVLVNEHKLAEHDDQDVRVFLDGKILEEYPPIIEIRHTKSMAPMKVGGKMHLVRDELGYGEKCLVMSTLTEDDDNIKIYTVLAHGEIDVYFKKLEEMLEEEIR